MILCESACIEVPCAKVVQKTDTTFFPMQMTVGAQYLQLCFLGGRHPGEAMPSPSPSASRRACFRCSACGLILPTINKQLQITWSLTLESRCLRRTLCHRLLQSCSTCLAGFRSCRPRRHHRLRPFSGSNASAWKMRDSPCQFLGAGWLYFGSCSSSWSHVHGNLCRQLGHYILHCNLKQADSLSGV